jgi:hypothetical protein
LRSEIEDRAELEFEVETEQRAEAEFETEFGGERFARTGEDDEDEIGLFERRTEVLPGDPDAVLREVDRDLGMDDFDDLLEGL